MIDPWVLVIMLAVAFGLSWVTANSAGRLWTESKIVGGSLRLMVIATLVLSAIGFTGVYLATLVVLATLFGMLDSTFVNMVFVPLAGLLGMSGVGAAPNMWVNSQIATRRQAMLAAQAAASAGGEGLLVAPGDVLEMALNSRGLVSNTDGFLHGLFKGFGKSGGGGKMDIDVDSDSAPIFAIIVLVALSLFALCAGVVTTILIVEHADKEHVGEIFELYQAAQIGGQ